MKQILPFLVLVMCGCNIIPNKSSNLSNLKDECPDQPQGTLEGSQVKSLALNNGSSSESGNINVGKQKGFSFEGKKKQKFNYRTKDSVCVWIYTPDAVLLKGDELPMDGKYTVQVSALKGSTSFNLELGLQDLNTATQPSTSLSSPSPIAQAPPAASEDRPKSPENFIKEHYSNLNARNYDLTWKSLSSEFQTISTGFSGYTEWWNSVERIELDSVNLVSKDSSQAIVDAELRYIMKTGVTSDDERGRIYLAWNSSVSNWEIVKKTSR
jgi:hypothetical protein